MRSIELLAVMNEGFSRSILHHECASKKVRRQRHDICIYRIRHNYLYLLSFSGIGYNEEHLTEAFLVLHVRTSALLRRHVETAGLWSDGNAKNRYRSSGLPPNAYQSFYLQRVLYYHYSLMSRIPLPLRRHGLYVAPTKLFLSRFLSILSCSDEQVSRQHQVTATTVDLLASVGNTPLLELSTLSRLTGCKLVAKAEYTNPSGSIKDRVAKSLILDAEERGVLEPGGTIIEATGGSTGVSLALLGASRGYKTLLTMPDITASEKVQMMKAMGAQVRVLPTTCISDKNHFFNVAQCLAETTANAYCPNQFDNTANMRAHYEGTAPEIWTQVQGGIHGFVTSAGTSGTIAGMSKFFKERNPDVKVWLIDPEETASMSAFINNDRSTSSIENGFEVVPMAGGWTIAEGVAALSRVTNNLRESIVDRGITATNKEIVDMSYFLLRNDGIFVGPSSALNVLGAVKMARELGPGHTIVTILADGGVRYGSKLYNEAWLKDHDLLPQDAVDKKSSPSLDFVRGVRFPTTV